jgi:hypothetical protein
VKRLLLPSPLVHLIDLRSSGEHVVDAASIATSLGEIGPELLTLGADRYVATVDQELGIVRAWRAFRAEREVHRVRLTALTRLV